MGVYIGRPKIGSKLDVIDEAKIVVKYKDKRDNPDRRFADTFRLWIKVLCPQLSIALA